MLVFEAFPQIALAGAGQILRILGTAYEIARQQIVVQPGVDSHPLAPKPYRRYLSPACTISG